VRQIVAVRVWLLVRSDTGEKWLYDSSIYEYGRSPAGQRRHRDLNAAAGAGLAYQPSLMPTLTLTGPSMCGGC